MAIGGVSGANGVNTVRGIAPLWEEMPLGPERVEVTEQQPVYSFWDIFRTAIAEAQTNQAEVANASYLLATGQLENPAYATIAVSKAELSVSMLVQLRNKALDAYNELMRINM